MATRVCGVKANETMANGAARWPVGTLLTYYEAMEFAGMARDQVAACYDRACAQWTAVCGIAFRRVADPAQARIVAGDASIDGPYGILAESDLPYNADANSQMAQEFDQAEPWGAEGTDLLVACMCHEIGHALGLEHLPGTGALMEPIIVPGRSTPQDADIAAARARYGPPSPTPAGPDFRSIGIQLIPYVVGPACDGLVAMAHALEAGASLPDATRVGVEKEAALRAAAKQVILDPRMVGLAAADQARACRALASGLGTAIVL